MNKYCAVIGQPIRHSKSPQVHLAFAAQVGIDLVYDQLESNLDGFGQTVNAFFSHGGTGLNVTLPFKTLAFKLAQKRTPEAELCGSVNTLYMDDNKLCGDTTDGRGLVNDLISKKISLQQAKVLVLGAGGACRSILPALLTHNCQISVLNRTIENAIAVVKRLSLEQHIEVIFEPQEIIQPYDLIINTLSQDASHWLEKYQITDLGHTTVYDISYGSRAEVFRRWCSRHSVANYFDGWGMLIEQAALSFEIWHHKKPDPMALKTN